MSEQVDVEYDFREIGDRLITHGTRLTALAREAADDIPLVSLPEKVALTVIGSAVKGWGRFAIMSGETILRANEDRTRLRQEQEYSELFHE